MLIHFFVKTILCDRNTLQLLWRPVVHIFSSVVSAQSARYDCFGPEGNRRLKSPSPDEADVDQRRLFSHTGPRADARVLSSVAMRLR